MNEQWYSPRKCKNCDIMVTPSECHVNEYVNVEVCESDGLCYRCYAKAREESK